MKRSGLRTASGMLAALPLCAFLLFASCSSSERAARSEGDSPLGTAEEPADAITVDGAGTGRSDIVTGPNDAVEYRKVGLTVGERLKQIDSLIQVVPADSLGILMAEYERLLDSAMGGSVSAASPESPSDEPKARETAPNYPRSTPRSSINTSAERVLVQSDHDTRSDAVIDPAEHAGVRDSEPEPYRGSTTPSSSTPAASTVIPSRSAPAQADAPTISRTPPARSGTSTSVSGETGTQAGASKPAAQTGKSTGKGKKKRKGGRRRAVVESTPAPAPPSTPEPKSTRSNSLNENYTEGLAHFRAGRYAQAIEDLKPVANSSGSSFRTVAKYYYALSLERTGSLSQAASQFRSLSGGSGAIADKAWLGYCRVLNAQGKRGEAKKELLRLIKQRPQSSQIANARQLLQKL